MKKKKHKVWDIVAYALIGVCFLLTLFGIISKFGQGSFYLFGHRADVVLSNSMSTKHPEYASFLEGHDNQMQKNDLVFSSKVDTNTELNVYDIVIFNNPRTGPTMHRIVGKKEKSFEQIKLRNGEKPSVGHEGAFILPTMSACIETSLLPYSDFYIAMYSVNEYDDRYHFSFDGQLVTPEVDHAQSGPYHVYNFHIHRDSARPSIFRMTHKKEFDYATDYFFGLQCVNQNKSFLVSPQEFTEVEDGLSFKTNVVYLYEIRGDANNLSDGEFTVDYILAKVEACWPKVGIIFGYLTSTFGIFMFVGIGFIIIAAELIYDHLDKKSKQEDAHGKA